MCHGRPEALCRFSSLIEDRGRPRPPACEAGATADPTDRGTPVKPRSRSWDSCGSLPEPIDGERDAVVDLGADERRLGLGRRGQLATGLDVVAEEA